MNFSPESLFAMLSGVSSGGTSAPYGAGSSGTGGMPSGAPGMQQSGSPMQGQGGNFNPQGNWQGNQSQPEQQGQGMGLSGMFKDIMGRAPAIYNAMQSKPGAPPMASLMNGINQGMRPQNAVHRY